MSDAEQRLTKIEAEIARLKQVANDYAWQQLAAWLQRGHDNGFWLRDNGGPRE